MYEISPESSKLSCSGADGSVLTAVYKKTAEFIGDNLVSNGSFEDENGNFSVEGWLTAKNSSDTIGNPFATDHFYAVTHEYTVNNNSSSPLSTVIPDGDWALGTKWNDGPSSGNNLCSIIRYVPVTVGKTYLISYKVKHRTGAQGTYLKTSLVPENKTGNSTITEANTTNPGFIGSDWTTITRTFTATEETDNVMFYFRWLGDGGSTPYWFFDDFSVREISPVEYTKVTFDEKEIITEGTLPLGEETAQGYILPSNVMGYNIVSANGDSKFVPAGITTVQNGDIITTVNTNIKMITGAQIRIGDGLDEDGKISTGSGIRFIAQIDRSNVDDTLFTYGIEISAQGSSRVLDVPAQIYQDDDHSVFTAVATNLSVSNYNRPYTAKAYVNAVYSDNTSSRIYAPASVTRSIYQVSAGLLKNGSNGLSNCEDVYGPGENSALYGVLNAYVNMVGVRLTLTKDGSVSVRTEGTGSYTGDPFFSVESVEKSEGVYTVTITPLADYSYRVTFASYWMDFIRINNNNSTVKSSISNSQINEDGSITFDFTPPQA